MQHATLFSAGFTALRRGMQKMQARRKHIRHRWSVKERLLLIASLSREGTTVISKEYAPRCAVGEHATLHMLIANPV